MVILKSDEEELHRFIPLLAGTKLQATPFAVYETRVSPPPYVWSPACLLEYTMAANHILMVYCILRCTSVTALGVSLIATLIYYEGMYVCLSTYTYK